MGGVPPTPPPQLGHVIALPRFAQPLKNSTEVGNSLDQICTNDAEKPEFKGTPMKQSFGWTQSSLISLYGEEIV